MGDREKRTYNLEDGFAFVSLHVSEIVLGETDIAGHNEPDDGSCDCVALKNDTRSQSKTDVSDVTSEYNVLFSLSDAVVLRGT